MISGQNSFVKINTYEVNVNLLTRGYKLMLFLSTISADVSLRFYLLVICYLDIFLGFPNVIEGGMLPIEEKFGLRGVSKEK